MNEYNEFLRDEAIRKLRSYLAYGSQTDFRVGLLYAREAGFDVTHTKGRSEDVSAIINKLLLAVTSPEQEEESNGNDMGILRLLRSAGW